MILLDVGQEAHVEHPVRLVEDEDLDLAEVGDAAGRRGRAAGPGVATRISMPPRSALIWGSIGIAAVDDRRAQRARSGRRSWTLSSTCIASSRVGTRMSTRTGWRAGEKLVFAWSRSRSRIGSTKAAVLPVPVWAAARTSRPSRTSGMAAVWTGVGVSYPSSATMRTRSADRPSESKVKRSLLNIVPPRAPIRSATATDHRASMDADG